MALLMNMKSFDIEVPELNQADKYISNSKTI